MVDINALKQAARIVKDENGEPVVQNKPVEEGLIRIEFTVRKGSM